MTCALSLLTSSASARLADRHLQGLDITIVAVFKVRPNRPDRVEAHGVLPRHFARIGLKFDLYMALDLRRGCGPTVAEQVAVEGGLLQLGPRPRPPAVFGDEMVHPSTGQS